MWLSEVLGEKMLTRILFSSDSESKKWVWEPESSACLPMSSPSWSWWIKGGHNESREEDLCWRFSWQSHKCKHQENWATEQEESGDSYPVGSLNMHNGCHTQGCPPHSENARLEQKQLIWTHWQFELKVEVRCWVSVWAVTTSYSRLLSQGVFKIAGNDSSSGQYSQSF